MDLPDSDHIMRHVSLRRLRRDGNGNVIGLLPQAFELRPGETGLSVNWLEYFQGTAQQNIKDSVHKFRATRNVGAKSAYGVGNVKKVTEVCRSVGANKARIFHKPSSANGSHSVISRIPQEDPTVCAALADEAFLQLVLDSQIP